MFKTISRVIDFIFSLVLYLVFAVITAGAFLLFIFRKERKRFRELNELCIGIIDIRQSIMTDAVGEAALHGYKKRVYYFHYDFDKAKDESAVLDDKVFLEILSVHPKNIMTDMGLNKCAGAIAGIKGFLRMLNTALNKEISVIRAHDPHFLGLNALILSKIVKIPFIVQVCSNYELKDRRAKGLTFRPFMFKSVERFTERYIMRSADMVLADREHYRLFGLIPKDIPEDKYTNMGFFAHDIHYTDPVKRHGLREKLGISPERKIILYVGRLCRVKYPLDLIRMLNVCLKSGRDVVLLIAGDGESRPEMENLASECGISGNVRYLGPVRQEALADYYYTADVVAFTSAGFTMIEAALAAKPIVAYDFEWHSEFIGNNERGLLVPFGDYNAMAEGIIRFLGNKELSNKFGEKAREYALSKYTRKRSTENELGAYKKIFRKRGYIFE